MMKLRPKTCGEIGEDFLQLDELYLRVDFVEFYSDLGVMSTTAGGEAPHLLVPSLWGM